MVKTTVVRKKKYSRNLKWKSETISTSSYYFVEILIHNLLYINMLCSCHGICLFDTCLNMFIVFAL